MRKKAVKKKKITSHKLFENILLDFLLFCSIGLTASALIQIKTKMNWGIFIIGSVIIGAIATFDRNQEAIAEYIKENKENKYEICDKCGYKNRKKAWFCSKCGKPLETFLESDILVYTGNEVNAFFVINALKEAKIIAWQNSMRYKTGLPVSVYTFGRDAEKAVEIIEKITGEKWKSAISRN